MVAPLKWFALKGYTLERDMASYCQYQNVIVNDTKPVDVMGLHRVRKPLAYSSLCLRSIVMKSPL
jgi:hypothetical protein